MGTNLGSFFFSELPGIQQSGNDLGRNDRLEISSYLFLSGQEAKLRQLLRRAAACRTELVDGRLTPSPQRCGVVSDTHTGECVSGFVCMKGGAFANAAAQLKLPPSTSSCLLL